jgi:hypothetical protein
LRRKKKLSTPSNETILVVNFSIRSHGTILILDNSTPSKESISILEFRIACNETKVILGFSTLSYET